MLKKQPSMIIKFVMIVRVEKKNPVYTSGIE